MIKEGLLKFNINRTNTHLKDIYTSTHYLELGTISYDILVRMLNYEMINLEDITYLPIQNRGVGKSNIQNEELRNILPFLFYENINRKNKSFQLMVTYGILRYKDEFKKEVFSPIVLIPVNIYIEKEKIFFQQISRPIENSILISYLVEVKKLNVIVNEKLDSAYNIDKFCMSFEKFEGYHLELENFLTFASLREHEIKIDHDKFEVSRTYDDYLYDKLFTSEVEPIYYSTTLNRLQRYALHSALNGNNIVITGRLGTGKTTVLTNIAINAINQGKRVLYVSNMKETLDRIYNHFVDKGINQYVTNFSNCFASFHQGELLTNSKSNPANTEDFDFLYENYNYINDYENAITGRILDNRFIEVINELVLISDDEKKTLDIDDLSHLYKHEYLSCLKSIEEIQILLNNIESFKNSIWKDIPILNNVKYPNQIFSLIYQVQKAFTRLDELKKVLEESYSFKPISNYAYLKNVIHNFKNLNIKDVPLSWLNKDNFEQAKEEYRNLKNEIYQIQELEYALNFKYENTDSIDIKHEINCLLGDFFTENDFEKIDLLLDNRVDLVVRTNKVLLHIDIFKKSLNKISNLMNWEFNPKNYILEELIKFSNVLLKVRFNEIFLKATLDNKYEELYTKVKESINLLEKYYDERNNLFKTSPINQIGEVENAIDSIEKYNNDKPIRKSAYRLIVHLKENQPSDFSNIIKNIRNYRELSENIRKEEENFLLITGFTYDKTILDDLVKFYEFIKNVNVLYKLKVIKFLERITEAKHINSKANKNYQKVFDLFNKSYFQIKEIYNDFLVYQFTSEKFEFVDKINDLYKITNYLQNLYISNDRILKVTKNHEKFVKTLQVFELRDSIEKIKSAKESLNKNEKYHYLYENLFTENITNINAIARLLQSFKVYSDCFIDNNGLIKSLDLETYNQINEQLNICSDVSDELNETFKIYFKIFKESVSRYFYNDFKVNLDYLNKLLNSKDELITYLKITENLKILYKYNLNKLVDYIINLENPKNMVNNFKYTYLSIIKSIYLEKHPSLSDYKLLENKLGITVQNEIKLIKEVENNIFKNIRKNSGIRFSVFGIRNLDYNAYIRRTNGIKSLFLTTTQILNNFINIKQFDLVLIDDAHLLSANEYYVAIQGSQVVISGEQQLQSAVANNLISRMSSNKNINLNYRFSPTPKNLLINMEGLKGVIYGDYYDNFGVEVIYEKLLDYIATLLKDNNVVINIFVASIDKQRSIYEELTDILLNQGYNSQQIIDIFSNNINISDLSLGYLYNADYNILLLEDYYTIDAEYLVVNMIDNLLLCKKKLIIYDYNNYLKEKSGAKFLIELKRIVNNKQVFNKVIASDILEKLVRKFEEAKFIVYSSNNMNLIIRKKTKLYGLIIFWDNNKTNYDIMNEYRDSYILHQKNDFKVFIIWSMELIQSIDEVALKIIEEINND